MEEDTLTEYDYDTSITMRDEMDDHPSTYYDPKGKRTLRQIDTSVLSSFERLPSVESSSRPSSAREASIMSDSDSFFAIPVGQKELWHDPSLEDACDEGLVESFLGEQSLALHL